MFELYSNSLQPALTLGWPITYLELVILVFNVVAVYLAGKNNIWTAPAAMVAVAAYCAFCFSFRFYSEFFLQIYFFMTNIWLLFSWKKKKSGQILEVHRLTPKQRINVALIWLLGTAVLALSIDTLFSGFSHFVVQVINSLSGGNYTYVHQAAEFPWVDAFTTVGQVVAMVLLVRRVWENWAIWICINIVSIPMFALKGGYGVSLMFVLFLGLAIKGHREWKDLIKQ